MVIRSNPCEKANCPENTVCKVRDGLACRGVNCEPRSVYECVLIEKPGKCPTTNLLRQSEQNACQQDSDCADPLKCCSSKDKKYCSSKTRNKFKKSYKKNSI